MSRTFDSPLSLDALPVGWSGEIIDEETYISPRPTLRQSRATFMLGAELGEWVEKPHGGNGRWFFLRAPELYLGADVLVPDIAGWKRERLASVDGADAAAHHSLAPDWVCEVLTPQTAGLDRTRKLPAYARAGVSYAWLVDPVAHTLEVYQRLKRGWLLAGAYEAEAMVRSEPFPSLVLDLEGLWLSEEGRGH